MSTPTKHDMLMTALEQTPNQSFSVTSIRDQIIRINPTQEFDPAELRRWVNGKFKTLLSKGKLEKKAVPGSKKYTYNLTSQFSAVVFETIHKKPATSLSVDINTTLTRQAQEYHRRLNIQLGEIAEYQRLSNEYPTLKTELDGKSVRLTEENHRLLGRLKALEEILNNRGPL